MSYSDVKKLTDDELVHLYAQMNWILGKEAKNYNINQRPA